MDHEWAVGDLEQQLCEAESEIESLREQLDTARSVYKYMCEEIQVGDLLILKDDNIVPADCVVLKTLSGAGEC